MATTKHNQIKLALIGCGRYGLGTLAPALARLAGEHPDRLELTAACDADGERAQTASDQFGFLNACDDVAAMIRDYSPTACVTALSAAETLMQGSQLLVQAMPCLFELPLGDSLDEAMEMSDAAGEMNTPHMVALNRRVNPYLSRAVKWARQLGPVQSVTCNLQAAGELDETYFGGTVVHAIDAIAAILGRLENFTLGTDGDKQTIDLRLTDGMAGRIAITTGATTASESYELTGDDFRAVATVAREADSSLQCWRDSHMEVNIIGKTAPPADDGAYELLGSFVDGLWEGKTPGPTIEDAMPAMDMTFQIAAELLKSA